ncbi:hypothetical protein AWV79_12460 [Cupriavidus sp. UYMMa02A]|nr:hypothetical protein AWV79_12460 [Cupriavidus sp. UYMMa02A]
MAETSHVLYSSVVDKDGDQYTPTTLTPTEDQREKIVLAKPYVMPIMLSSGFPALQESFIAAGHERYLCEEMCPGAHQIQASDMACTL